MSVNLNDLPPALRAQVDAKLDTGKRKRTRAGAGGPIDGHCHTCGEAFNGRGAEKRWEAHVDESGHARLELVKPWDGTQ